MHQQYMHFITLIRRLLLAFRSHFDALMFSKKQSKNLLRLHRRPPFSTMMRWELGTVINSVVVYTSFVVKQTDSIIPIETILDRMASRFLPQVFRVASRQPSLLRISASRSFVSATSPLLEKKTVQVPSMGDSITEVSMCFVMESVEFFLFLILSPIFHSMKGYDCRMDRPDWSNGQRRRCCRSCGN
jgi:hypothetical protein